MECMWCSFCYLICSHIALYFIIDQLIEIEHNKVSYYVHEVWVLINCYNSIKYQYLVIDSIVPYPSSLIDIVLTLSCDIKDEEYGGKSIWKLY